MRTTTTLFLCLYILSAFAQIDHERVYTTFDNLYLSKSDTFDNGADMNEGFHHYGRYFPNTYDTAWGGSWSGWSLSNMKDAVTPGFMNQYSAKTGQGVSNTTSYAIGYKTTYIALDSATEISGAYFTNTTYAYFEILNGSNFSKKFGGPSGNDSDYYKLVVTSYLEGVQVANNSLYLADYRGDTASDYILDEWTYLDFNNDLDNDELVDSLVFSFESSDTGMWGINTPTYFAMDDFNSVSRINYEWRDPLRNFQSNSFYNGSDGAGGFLGEYIFYDNSYDTSWGGSWTGWSLSTMYDDTTAGFGNQYSAINQGFSQYHCVSYGVHNQIRSKHPEEKNVLWKKSDDSKYFVGNTTYAYLDMLSGSGFTKKFGGPNGTDPDYFRVIVKTWTEADSLVETDTVYLADFRFADDSKDYILDKWVELFPGYVAPFSRMTFDLESSDTGIYGMNTPAYFALSAFVNYGNVQEIVPVDVQIFPNPANSKLSVVSDKHIKNISVYSMNGQLFYNRMVDDYVHVLDVTDLISGMYFVKLTTEDGIVASKFIKH